MLGWILHRAGKSPTIMNGAEMKNFIDATSPFASARIGKGEVFVSEVDESDGSIAFFEPRVAVVNNISLDHKSLDELRTLFRGFIAKAQTVVLNLDNAETAALLAGMKPGQAVTYSLHAAQADLLASAPVRSPAGIAFQVKARDTGETVEVDLKVPGLHNVANALAALSAAKACGVALAAAAAHLGEFSGIRRRLEVVGTANEITVVDDFAHNPDKISATLETMHAFPGRLLLMFQPHGYGPIRLMRDALVDCFASGLQDEDVLVMPEPVYFGGTVDRSVGSHDIVCEIQRRGRKAFAFPDRSACGDALVRLARRGDRIVVMGARDDSLSQFAHELLRRLALKKTNAPGTEGRLRCTLSRAQSEEPLLRRKATSESSQFAGRSNDPVAWRDDRDRILAVSGSHRSRRRWLADLSCDLAIAAGLAERDREQRFPDSPLECGPLEIERQGECLALPREVGAELPLGLEQNGDCPCPRPEGSVGPGRDRMLP